MQQVIAGSIMLDRPDNLEAEFPSTEPRTIVPNALGAPSVPDAPEIRRPSILLRLSRGFLQIILMVAILGGSIFGMNRLIKAKPETKARSAFKTVYTIKTVEALRTTHQPQFISYGQIEAARKVDLRSLVSGEVVSVSSKLQVGARVAAGEALVEINRFNYEGALREASANLKEALARLDENHARIVSEQSKLASASDQLAIAERDLTRARSLSKNGTMTTQQVEVRSLVFSQRQQALTLSQNMVNLEQARLGQQQAAIERLQWRVAQAERNLQNTVLKAPFAGIVRSSAVDVGKLLSANDVVVSLYEPDKLEAKFTLTDAQFGRLQDDKDGLIERKVTVSWNTGGQQQTYDGKISRIGADINSSRGGIEVFATIEPTGSGMKMRPGAFVEITVPDKTFENTIKLPEHAVYNGQFVYVVSDGELAKRQVTIVAFDGEAVLVSSGLESGEKVLATRIAEVGNGLRVREEGDESKPDAAQKENLSSSVSNSVSGGPSAEELEKILIANNLTRSKWENLDRAEQRRIVRTHRTVQGG